VTDLASDGAGSLEPATFAGRAMGSPLRLTLGRGAELEPTAMASAWSSVVRSFEVSEQAMSRFRASSELTALNRSAGSGAVRSVSARLRSALVAADRANRVSAGRFDPRIIGDLDRLGYRGVALPTSGDRLRTATGSGGDGHRVVERCGRDGVRLARPVDLGGIGKGLALRWSAGELARAGTSAFLLDAGGDLVARGTDPAGGPWLIGLEDPTERTDHLAVIAVEDGAAATSSVRVHRWTVAGRDVHHLIDPATGEPSDGGLLSVTVTGPDPAWAEVWSKVLFIGGREPIAGEARARDLAAWWVTDDGSLEMTARARACTVWVAAEDTGRG
jgi:FAD:protein FMN transferase